MTITVKEYFNLLEKGLVNTANEEINLAEQAAKNQTPVVTGTTINSYFVEKISELGEDAVLGNTVPWFDALNNGTRHFSPRAMIPAAVNAIPKDATRFLKDVK